MKLSRIAFAAALAVAIHGSSAPAGDFDGAYVGAGLSAGFNAPTTPDWEGSAFIGYNFDFGNRMVAGAELDLTVNPNSLWAATQATTGTLDARLGYLVSDNVMAYGRGGGGYTTGGPGSYVWDLGAGVEYMMDSGYTLRGEFDRVDPFTAGMLTQVNARLGVVMNF